MEAEKSTYNNLDELPEPRVTTWVVLFTVPLVPKLPPDKINVPVPLKVPVPCVVVPSVEPAKFPPHLIVELLAKLMEPPVATKFDVSTK